MVKCFLVHPVLRFGQWSSREFRVIEIVRLSCHCQVISVRVTIQSKFQNQNENEFTQTEFIVDFRIRWTHWIQLIKKFQWIHSGPEFQDQSSIGLLRDQSSIHSSSIQYRSSIDSISVQYYFNRLKVVNCALPLSTIAKWFA